MIFWKLCSLLSLAVLSASTLQADAQCTQPRVRRSWTSLTAADRKLYLDAVAASMDSGGYIKFVEIHTEMMSEREAHRQCMFIYWHRMLLAAFENMLRGQGARFACVTVPYWDWITDYNKFATGQCRNILTCSPALNFLGGLPPTTRRTTVTINGERVSGFCETDAPMNRFCQGSTVASSACSRCLPRENWSRVTFPAVASYASVRAQLFASRNIGEMSRAIEEGAHNNIHAVLGSTMATFNSPADPVFWSHHAMVDLLHSVFHKCKVGEQKMTMKEKGESVDWTSCERRPEGSGKVFDPEDFVMMRTGAFGRTPTNATRDRVVGKFFQTVPQQFGALVDTRDLGASSYSYELQGLTATLYQDCGVPTTTRLLTEGNVTTPTESPVVTAPANTTEAPTTTAPANTTAANATATANVTAAPPPPMSAMINRTTDSTTVKMGAWMNSTDKLVKRRGGDAVLEAEKMACLFQDECLGGVSSYTAEFKKKFCVTTEPRCKQIVDRIRRTGESLKITEWKAQMIKTFGCPTPKNATNATTAPTAMSTTPSPATQTIVSAGVGQSV